MVNYHKEFRQLLIDAADGVEVYYEAFAEKEATPCISYMEASNISSAIGDTLKYSEVVYQVKVWAETIEELVNISNNIDDKLESIGFKRTSGFETSDNGLLVKIMKYRGIGYNTL